MIFILILLCFLQEKSADENVKSTTGMVQKSVKMKCDTSHLDKDDIAKVEWFDYVYNSDEDPIQIFSSFNNSDSLVNLWHPNSKNMEVDSYYTLTINLLSMENDPGSYFCIVHGNNNDTRTHSYYLSISAAPECVRNSRFKEMDDVYLKCSANHSGKVLPKLDWYRGEQVLKSDHSIEIRRVTESVKFKASWEDNMQRFTCQMIFGEYLEECGINMDVSYFVRDITIEPAKKTHFFVRDEIRCSANGNPYPKISFEETHLFSTKKSALRTKSISIPPAWENKAINLSCFATNTIGHQPMTKWENFTIQVSAHAPVKIRQAIEKAFDSTTAAVIGIIVVASVLLVIIFITVFIKKRKKSKRNSRVVKKEPVQL